MSANFDVIVIFSIYWRFGAIQKPDSGRIVRKTYISLTVTFILQKLIIELNNLLHSSHTIALSKGAIFAKTY